jgi:hypothetical protein
MKGVLPLLRRALRAGTRDFCPALTALVGPVHNIFFIYTEHFFTSFVPIAQGRQSSLVTCFLISVSGYSTLTGYNVIVRLARYRHDQSRQGTTPKHILYM